MQYRVKKNTCQNYEACVKADVLCFLVSNSGAGRVAVPKSACECCNAYIPKKEGEDCDQP